MSCLNLLVQYSCEDIIDTGYHFIEVVEKLAKVFGELDPAQFGEEFDQFSRFIRNIFTDLELSDSMYCTISKYMNCHLQAAFHLLASFDIAESENGRSLMDLGDHILKTNIVMEEDTLNPIQYSIA